MTPPDDPLPPHDPLWKVLEGSSQSRPRANFVADTLRAARLSDTSQSGLRGLLHQFRGSSLRRAWVSSAVLCATALLLFAGFIWVNPTGVEDSPPSLGDSSTLSEVAWLEEALLSAALDAPELFSDEELVALLF